MKPSWNIVKFNFVSYYIIWSYNILIAAKKYKPSAEKLSLVLRPSIDSLLAMFISDMNLVRGSCGGQSLGGLEQRPLNAVAPLLYTQVKCFEDKQVNGLYW